MIMDGRNKKTSKVLSTNEIRAQARNWSLAGDAGLLAHLEQFSEKICSKTQDTNSQLNELLEGYEEIHKKIDNVTNQFLALQNCQFVENRVYDEETPTEENIKKNIVDVSEREKFILQQYKEAVDIGVKLLDTHFEVVELPPNSDSDEDEDVPSGNFSLIWKPTNPYSKKKFPLLIGSSEWWKDDRVGLGEAGENFVTEKEESDVGSELDSEQENFGQDIHVSSSSSLENEEIISCKKDTFYEAPEDLFGLDKTNDIKGCEPNLFDVSKGDSSIGKSEIFSSKLHKKNILTVIKVDQPLTEEAVSEKPIGTSLVNKELTRELAAKLENSAKNNTKILPAINNSTKLVTREQIHSSSNLFDDDDDDNNDIFSKKEGVNPMGKKSMFSEKEKNGDFFGVSHKLFDELEDDLFDADIVSKPNVSATQASSHPKSVSVEDNSKSILENDGDIAEKNNFYDEESGGLFSCEPAVKIKVNSGTSEDEGNLFSESKSSIPGKMKGKTTKSKSLFDDEFDDDLDGFDIFQTQMIKGKTSDFIAVLNEGVSDDLFSTHFSERHESELSLENHLFPELKTDLPSEGQDVGLTVNSDYASTVLRPENDSKDDLFGANIKNLLDEKNVNPPKSISMLDQFDDDASLFLEKPKLPDTASISSSRSSLFDDIPGSKTRLASVFEKDKNNKVDDDLFTPSGNSLFANNIPGSKTNENDLFRSTYVQKKVNEKSSLFGDFGDDDDETDLFRGNKEPVTSRDLMLQKDETAKAALKSIKESSDYMFEHYFTQSGDKTVFEKDLIDGASLGLQKEGIFAGNSFLNGLEAEVDDLFGDFVANSKKTEKSTGHSKETKNNSMLDPTSVTKSMKETTSLFERDELFEKETILGESATATSPVSEKPKTPNILNLKEVSEQENNKGKVVGKLNIPQNLKTRLEASVKHVSSDSGPSLGLRKPDNPKEKTQEEDLKKPYEPASNLLKCPSKDRVKIPGRRRPQSRRARQEAIRNSGVSFLDGDSKIVVSESTAASSKSNSSSSGVCVISKNTTVIQEKDATISPDLLLPKSHPLSPSTDEEDIFNIPGLDTNFEKEDQNLFKTDLFESNNSIIPTDNSLFDGGPVLSPLESRNDDLFTRVTTAKKQSEIDEAGGNDNVPFLSSQTRSQFKISGNLFRFADKCASDKSGDDDDDDDDYDEDNLFKSKGLGEGIQGRKSQDLFPFIQGLKKPLFSDKGGGGEDDDEDLFGKKFEVPIKQSIPAPTAVEEVSKVISAIERKEEDVSESNSSSKVFFLDPLGLMSNDYDS